MPYKPKEETKCNRTSGISCSTTRKRLRRFSGDGKKRLEPTSEITKSLVLKENQDIKAVINTISQEETLKNSSSLCTTMEVMEGNPGEGNGKKSLVTYHPLPTKRSPYVNEFLRLYDGYSLSEIKSKEAIIDEAVRCEIRDSDSISPQTRLTAATDNLHAVTPQKIEINKTERKYDVAQILDRLTTLAELKKTLENEINSV